jgi:NAD(P)-dependent dehydrogenase (short-subunit alcohol dehydrogenase family)
MGRLDGKVAAITGAASGIGAASAVRFAQEGASVVVADLNADGGNGVVAQCAAAGGQACFQRTDVAQEADIAALVARAVKEYGRLDVLFNNAGLGGAVGPIDETSVEDWDKTQAVLLRAVFLGIKHAAPVMRTQGGGSIISTASVAGVRGGAGPHAYSAAKAGVINLTRSVAIELAKDQIRVNCICPGGINTPLIHTRIPGGQEVAAQFMTQLQPWPRAGVPDDIANMALFLASDESTFVTGAAMIVDGGFTAGGSTLQGMRPPMPAGYSGPSFEPEWGPVSDPSGEEVNAETQGRSDAKRERST